MPWVNVFEASLVYRMNSRTVRTIERNPVSHKQTKQANNSALYIFLSKCNAAISGQLPSEQDAMDP